MSIVIEVLAHFRYMYIDYNTDMYSWARGDMCYTNEVH